MSQQEPSPPSDCPVAIAPRYHTAEPNEPDVLYDGEAQFQIDGATVKKNAEVRLRWLPTPHVEIRIADCAMPRPLATPSPDVLLQRRPAPYSVRWTRMSFGGGTPPPALVGTVGTADLEPDVAMRRLVFHVANGPKFRGTHVRNATDRQTRLGRVELTVTPWRIAIDEIAEWQSREAQRKLKDTGGYAITHVGRIEHEDGSSFRADAVESLRRTIGFLLSFCRGAWAWPLLPVATDAADHDLFSEWQCGRIAAWQSVPSWFHESLTEGLAIIEPMHRRLNDPVWDKPAELALFWYPICNDAYHSSVEGAIVLQQAALEMLAWTLLVEDRKALTISAAKKLNADGRLRRLFRECRIPLDIPSELAALKSAPNVPPGLDGPGTTIKIRNALAHTTQEKHGMVFGEDPQYLVEAWSLGQWYLDLVLLWLCDYKGHYVNRLKRDVLLV